MMSFSWKNFGLVLGMTLLVGIAQYAVAWQFNDGKMSQRAVGAVVIGMTLPSLLIGGVMRLFRPDLQRYFALTIIICLVVGLFLIFSG